MQRNLTNLVRMVIKCVCAERKEGFRIPWHRDMKRRKRKKDNICRNETLNAIRTNEYISHITRAQQDDVLVHGDRQTERMRKLEYIYNEKISSFFFTL